MAGVLIEDGRVLAQAEPGAVSMWIYAASMQVRVPCTEIERVERLVMPPPLNITVETKSAGMLGKHRRWSYADGGTVLIDKLDRADESFASAVEAPYSRLADATKIGPAWKTTLKHWPRGLLPEPAESRYMFTWQQAAVAVSELLEGHATPRFHEPFASYLVQRRRVEAARGDVEAEAAATGGDGGVPTAGLAYTASQPQLADEQQLQLFGCFYFSRLDARSDLLLRAAAMAAQTVYFLGCGMFCRVVRGYKKTGKSVGWQTRNWSDHETKELYEKARSSAEASPYDALMRTNLNGESVGGNQSLYRGKYPRIDRHKAPYRAVCSERRNVDSADVGVRRGKKRVRDG